MVTRHQRALGQAASSRAGGRRRASAFLFTLGAVVAATPGSLGCSRAPAPPGALVARRGAFVRRLVLTGEMKAASAAVIAVPRTEEWQIQIKWMERDGARVRAGQRVIEFDSSPFASGLEEKRLAVLRARRESERERAAVATDLADKTFAREKCRIAVEQARIAAAVPEELMSRRDFQDRQLKLEKAGVELEKASDQLAAGRTAGEARVEVQRIALDTAERDVQNAETTIASLVCTAPREGIFQVKEHPWEGRKFQVGDAVYPGFMVAEVPDPASLMVEALLVDVDDGLVVPGLPVRCTLDTFPELAYEGKVLAVSPVAREPARGSQSRAFRVDVALISVDGRTMRVGMSVKVEVEVERISDALVAPRAGLEIGPDGARARTAAGRWLAVKLGPCSAQGCVVLDGLAEGAVLATAQAVDR
jgi:HlyD family secretion protein